MDIEKVDKNFVKEELVQSDDKKCYTLPCKEFDLYGVFYDEKREKFMRMDGDLAESVSEAIGCLAGNTSGGRIRFSTDAIKIGIAVEYNGFRRMPHMPLTGSSGFVLLEKIGNDYKLIATFRPNYDEESGYTGETLLEGKKKREFVLYFPLYNEVKSLKIYLDKEAKLYEAEKYLDRKPILYYGTSIEQGACASRPDCSYPAMISKWNNIDFINLGLSGNAKGETAIAEYLTKIDCSLFFFGYDGNAPGVEYLRNTHFPFYQTYRKVRPNVPIVFMSIASFDKYPNASASRQVIIESYNRAVEQGDKNVYFVDGKTVFGKKDREICTVEGIHPNDLGFYRIAKVVYELFERIYKNCP